MGMAGGGSPGAQRVDSGLSQTSGLLIARLGPSEHVTSPGVSSKESAGCLNLLYPILGLCSFREGPLSGELFGKKTLVKIRCPKASSPRPGPEGPAGLFLPSLLTSHSYLLHEHASPKTNAAGTLE